MSAWHLTRRRVVDPEPDHIHPLRSQEHNLHHVRMHQKSLGRDRLNGLFLHDPDLPLAHDPERLALNPVATATELEVLLEVEAPAEVPPGPIEIAAIPEALVDLSVAETFKAQRSWWRN